MYTTLNPIIKVCSSSKSGERLTLPHRECKMEMEVLLKKVMTKLNIDGCMRIFLGVKEEVEE